jgi:hypothetical protein
MAKKTRKENVKVTKPKKKSSLYKQLSKVRKQRPLSLEDRVEKLEEEVFGVGV